MRRFLIFGVARVLSTRALLRVCIIFEHKHFPSHELVLSMLIRHCADDRDTPADPDSFDVTGITELTARDCKHWNETTGELDPLVADGIVEPMNNWFAVPVDTLKRERSNDSKSDTVSARPTKKARVIKKEK